MSDQTENQSLATPAEVPSSPASPAEGPPVGEAPSPPVTPPAKPSLFDNPKIIAAATGKNPKNGRFQPGNTYNNRPTIKTDEVVIALLEGLRLKSSISGAVANAGIALTTFRRWRREDPEFAELVSMAEAHATAEIVAKLKSACEGTKDGQKRKDWRGYAWLLERRTASRVEFAKHTPDAITHDVLANAISKVVASIMPKIAETERPAVLQAMESVFAGLKPAEKDDEV